jgi:hypothetical protein
MIVFMERPRRMAEVFLDTAYAIALAAPTDDFHQQTSIFARWDFKY